MELVALGPSTPDEAAEDAAPEGEEQPVGISFFGDDEDAICTRVWNLYLRESVEQGFEEDTKKRGVLAPHLAAIQPRTQHQGQPEKHQEEEPMAEPGKTKRGALLERVCTTHRELSAKHGREPSIAEVYGAIGVEVGKSLNNVGMALRRARKNGLLGAAAPFTPSRTKAAPPQARTPKKRTITDLARGLAPPPKQAVKETSTIAPGGGDDSLLAGLIARRDFHADKVAALTIAIEALGGKS